MPDPVSRLQLVQLVDKDVTIEVGRDAVQEVVDALGHRRRSAVPVMRPEPSRKVVVPLLLVVAVPVWRPELSRNVVVPFELRVAVPVWRPLVSRKVVCARAAEVTSLSIELTYRGPADRRQGGASRATDYALGEVAVVLED